MTAGKAALAVIPAGLLLAACASRPLPAPGCEWLPPPPSLGLCKPGEAPEVDENLIADCTALTAPVGDWLLTLAEDGRENCPGSGW